MKTPSQNRKTTRILAGSVAALLAISSAQAASIFWLGTTDGNFNANNWTGTSGAAMAPALVPLNNDVLNFDNSETNFAGTFAINNDLTLTGLTLAITDNSVTDDFAISGNAISVGSGGIVSNVLSGTGVALGFVGGITLDAAASFNAVAGILTITSGVDNAGNLLTVTGAGNTSITGVITGAGGLTKTNAGALFLFLANNYTGQTTVTQGTVFAEDVNVLGTGAPLLVNGGTVDLGVGSTVGAVTLTSGSILGPVVFLTGTSFAVESGTVSARLAGSGATLTKTTAGTVTLSGANSFSGQMTVQDGTVSISTINNASAAGVLGNSALAAVLGNTGGQTGTLQYTGVTASSTKPFTMASGGTGAFQVDTAATTLTLSGLINGGGGLSKTGPGTMVLSNATNTYTGGTTVSGGILIASRSGSGTFSFGGTVTLANGTSLYTNTNNGTFTIGTPIDIVSGVAALRVDNGGTLSAGDLIITGSITGAGGLIMTGTNNGNRRKLELQGAKTFLGGVTLQQTVAPNGTFFTNTAAYTRTRLVIFDKASLGTGTLRSELVKVDGASTGGLEVPNGNTSNSGTNFGLETGTGVTNAIDLATGANLNVTTSQTNALQLSGVISGAGSLTTRAPSTNPINLSEASPNNLPGLLILSGANTYTGSTFVNTGTLQIGNGGTTGSLSPSSAIVVSNPNAAVNGATGSFNINNYVPTLAFKRSDTLTQGVDFAAVISGAFGQVSQTGIGTTILTGTNTYTGLTIVQAGTLTLGHATDTIANAAPVLVSGGNLDVANPDTVGAVTLSSGTISGVGALTGSSYALTNAGTISASLGANAAVLTKTGAGLAFLTGINGYTGGTVINGGTLNVNDDLALGDVAGAVTISNGATLQADGTVTTAARTLTLGVGGAVIDTNGNDVNFNSGSTVTGTTLTKTGSGTLNFGVSGNLTGLGALAANDGATNVNSALGIGASTVSATGTASLKFGSVSQTLGSLTIGAGATVTFTSGLAALSGGGGKGPGFGAAVVPEPGSIALLLTGALGAVARRRRQG